MVSDFFASLGAFRQIAIRFLAIEPMKQFPRGVAEPEERLAILRHEESLIVADLEARQR